MVGRRVLVAGGAGFIGSHLARRLSEDGAHVTVVDDLCTGRAANLGPIAGCLVEQDVCSWQTDERFDVVFNLASPASPVQYRRLALHTLRTGSRGTERLLELAERSGAVFVQASTSEVYGNPLVHPQPESYRGNVDPVGPRAMYDEAKRFAEALCSSWAERGVRVRIARIFNTYGPRMQPDDGRAVPSFVHAARLGRALLVHGDGSQTRSFCYVDDLVRGLIALARSDLSGPVNLGNPVETSVLELARTIVDLTGSRSRIAFGEAAADDPVRRCPDIGRARRELGWEPTVSLRDGLRATIDAQGAEVA